MKDRGKILSQECVNPSIKVKKKWIRDRDEKSVTVHCVHC